MVRKLDDVEIDAFDHRPDRTNPGFEDRFCCPHCLEDNHQRGPGDNELEVVECQHCDREFVVWVEEQPVACSRKLPTP